MNPQEPRLPRQTPHFIGHRVFYQNFWPACRGNVRSSRCDKYILLLPITSFIRVGQPLPLYQQLHCPSIVAVDLLVPHNASLKHDSPIALPFVSDKAKETLDVVCIYTNPLVSPATQSLCDPQS